MNGALSLSMGQDCYKSARRKSLEAFACLENGDYEGALVGFVAAVDLLPEDGHLAKAQICSNIGHVLVRLQKYEEAATSFGKTLEIFLRSWSTRRESLIRAVISAMSFPGRGRSSMPCSILARQKRFMSRLVKTEKSASANRTCRRLNLCKKEVEGHRIRRETLQVKNPPFEPLPFHAQRFMFATSEYSHNLFAAFRLVSYPSVSSELWPNRCLSASLTRISRPARKTE